MAHFAKLDADNRVIAIHVVNNDVITVDGVESEQKGIDFLTELHGHSKWKQTSYNKSFRGNYAHIGGKYDEALDAFIYEQPFPSWTLNTQTYQWEAPVPAPANGAFYIWSEAEQSWVPINA